MFVFRSKTEKHGSCIEHVYTDIFDGRYCGCGDYNTDVNEKIGEELKKSKVVVTAMTPATSSERTITSEDDFPRSSPIYVSVATPRLV